MNYDRFFERRRAVVASSRDQPKMTTGRVGSLSASGMRRGRCRCSRSRAATSSAMYASFPLPILSVAWFLVLLISGGESDEWGCGASRLPVLRVVCVCAISSSASKVTNVATRTRTLGSGIPTSGFAAPFFVRGDGKKALGGRGRGCDFDDSAMRMIRRGGPFCSPTPKFIRTAAGMGTAPRQRSRFIGVGGGALSTPLFMATSSEELKWRSAAHPKPPRNRNHDSTGGNNTSTSRSGDETAVAGVTDDTVVVSPTGTSGAGNDGSAGEDQVEVEGEGSVMAASASPMEDAHGEEGEAAPPTPPPPSLAERLARAAHGAAAALEARELAARNITNPNEAARVAIKNEPQVQPLGSLSELTKILDEKLHTTGPRGSGKGGVDQYPVLDGIVRHARDSMSSLLGHNNFKGDWSEHLSKQTFNVAILFGKPLVRDQVTVEYASRIRMLAKLLKHEPLFRPSLLCFVGSTGPGNHVSDADAGYVFFRHMCEAQGINLEGVEVFLDSKSRDEAEAVQRITEEVRRNHLPAWLDKSPALPVEADEAMTAAQSDEFRRDGQPPPLGRKKIDVHFIFISTEYHLCNLNDVHHRSPRHSLLKPIEALQEESERSASTNMNAFPSWAGGVGGGGAQGRLHVSGESGTLGHPDYFSEYSDGGEDDDYLYDDSPPYSYSGDYDDDFSCTSDHLEDDSSLSDERSKKRSPLPEIRGIVKTSWSFQYATYPYIHSNDDTVAYLGKCYLLGEELMPLLVNMKGVVEKTEFFQRDNYLLLASIRRSLVSHVEELHKPRRSLRNSLRVYAESASAHQYAKGGVKGIYTADRAVDIVLEGALLSLGRCIELVRPAGLLVSSVPKSDWVKALTALEHSMSEIHAICDPDRPLRPSEWGKLVDDADIVRRASKGMENGNVLNRKMHESASVNGHQVDDEDDEFAIFRDE